MSDQIDFNEEAPFIEAQDKSITKWSIVPACSSCIVSVCWIKGIVKTLNKTEDEILRGGEVIFKKLTEKRIKKQNW